MIRIAIAEDDLICAQLIQQYLDRMGQETGRTFRVTHYETGEDLLEQYKGQFDLILMDIEMPYLDGMRTAEQIRRQDQAVAIIFVTNMAQYAIRGYEVNAIDMKCHDLKHQISALARVSDEAARSEYVAEIQQAVSIYEADYHTGCEPLDYVLREKALISNQHHVTFSCMADGEAISFLHLADIYALMGNALDNALNRVLQEPEEQRIISLQIKRVGDMVLLHLENRCSQPGAVKNACWGASPNPALWDKMSQRGWLRHRRCRGCSLSFCPSVSPGRRVMLRSTIEGKNGAAL